jgi:aspartate kinase
MGLKVSKFGGTSLADSSQFRKVCSIIKDDSQRRYIVPSAFGKRFANDIKVTDLLYTCYKNVLNGDPFEDTFNFFEERCTNLVNELELSIDIRKHTNFIKEEIANGASKDYVASRGEYISGLILSELIGYEFIDAAKVIKFDDKGLLSFNETEKALTNALSNCSRAVIPGFYGSTQDGSIKTFTRGGSDITGAIVARFSNADIYENWTDVPGLLMTDPTIVENPMMVKNVTYRELRELAYMGATVIHDEAVRPVREVGIPINLRSTNEPTNPGTFISRNSKSNVKGSITGISGRKGFTVITLELNPSNTKTDCITKILNILQEKNLSFERLPSGIDTISIVISNSNLENNLGPVIEEIKKQCQPDAIDVYSDLALIATVGEGMVYTPGTAARLCSSLHKANVNIRLIDQGSSEINIVVGVADDDFQHAIQAIYKEFAS